MQGGFTNVYAQRIFCGWDFGITNCEAAELRKQTLYNELRELLDEETIAERSGAKTWMQRLVLMACRVGVTMLVCSLLIGSGVLVWFLLDKQYLLVYVSCNNKFLWLFLNRLHFSRTIEHRKVANMHPWWCLLLLLEWCWSCPWFSPASVPSSNIPIREMQFLLPSWERLVWRLPSLEFY